MILTQCACCAAPLPHLAKQCSRCKTRYCGPACQAQHWKEGGHDKCCKQIRKGGGAEQYYANMKYATAVAAAVEKCAADTKGQICYICMEGNTKESLVRGCACHTTEGFVHVSCLAEQAKILVAEAVENKMDLTGRHASWGRWYKCGLCEQEYHGEVYCALGWACWKTYLGRPERAWTRQSAMQQLGNGLYEVKCHEEELSVRQAELSMLRRLGVSGQHMLAGQGNLANTHQALGRFEESFQLTRDVHSGFLKLKGEEHSNTLLAARKYAASLIELQRFKEARALLRKTMHMARRVLGERNDLLLRMRRSFAEALDKDPSATLGDFREAVNTMEDTERIARRVLGDAHPTMEDLEHYLRESRAVLSSREHRWGNFF